MKFWKSGIVGMAFAIVFVGPVANAHKGATGIVKERMDGMVAMKEALATIGSMVRGITEIDFVKAADAAETMRLHGKRVTALFPDTPESRQMVSEATAAVWESPEDFAEKNAEFLERVFSLREVIDAKDVDALPQAFAQAGSACSSCHEVYRRKK